METKQHDKTMNVVEHLDELRKRIIIVGTVFILFFILGFVFVKDIYVWLAKDIDFKLTVISPTEIIWVYFALAGIVAIAGTIPVFAWQLWLFIKPGLTKSERRITLSYIPALFILFIAGLSFGYFIILPFILDFLISLNGDMFTTMFTTEKYFRFVLRMTIPFSVLFELPVVVMFLTSLGVIDPFKLTKIRKYAYFVLIVVSTMITPPDFLSAILVSIPLLLLYESSIILSKVVYKRKLKKQQKEAVEHLY